MKVTLYMAISIDGYIAKPDMSTNWVFESDFAMLEEKIQKHGCVIIGNTTFKEIGATEGVVNIIVSESEKETNGNVIYSQSVSNAMKTATDKGFEKALLIGGGTINGSFISENCISDVILSVHPIILGKGIKIFENYEGETRLEFKKFQEFDDGLIHLHYEVKK